MNKKTTDQSATSADSDEKAEVKKTSAFSISQEPVSGEAVEADVHKYEAAGLQEAPASGGGGEGAVPEFEDLGALPASYYEDTIFLVARDPRWLFCYWDFNWTAYPANAHRYNVAQFFLKIRTAAGAEETTVEIKPEARNWYVPVSTPGASYVGEIGFFEKAGAWRSIVSSEAAQTPPDALAEETEAQFATVPAHLAFERLLMLVTEHMQNGESLLQAISRITGEGREIAFAPGRVPSWSETQRALLTALLGDSLVDRVGLGSAEIDQLLRKQLTERLQSESSSGLASKFYDSLTSAESSLFSGIVGGLSSGGMSSWGGSWSAQPFSAKTERGFYMHVNAEIIFYGGTSPDATVWIEGKQIKLNPDGTFRYHFTLPDGDFTIPIVAESADKVEQRSATLTFARGTARVGDVGSSAQPVELGPIGRL